MKTYVYIHVCCINNWKTIFTELMFKIKESGLYEKVDEIRCFLLGEFTIEFWTALGDYESSVFNDPKIHIVKTSNNLALYEKFTLDVLHEDAQKEEFYALYIHSKGVSNQYVTDLVKAANVKDWVNYMCYFLMYKHEKCLDLLNTADTVGVSLRNIHKLHYSGNYWWSKASYIRTLKKCTLECYNSPEFWLTETWSGVYESLWDSDTINHQEEAYPLSEYSSYDNS